MSSKRKPCSPKTSLEGPFNGAAGARERIRGTIVKGSGPMKSKTVAMRLILLLGSAALLLLCETATAQHITIEVSDSVRAQVGDEVYGIQYHAHTYDDPAALTRLRARACRLRAFPTRTPTLETECVPPLPGRRDRVRRR